MTNVLLVLCEVVMNESWVSVEGFENLYEVSNLGNVRSCARVVYDQRTGTRTKKEKLLKLTQDSPGYLRVTLYKGTHYKEVWKVHRLVAKHFCVKPVGCDVVNHIDNIKTNNASSNLEWTTALGNSQHMMAQGRKYFPSGDESTSAKITTEQAIEIIRLASEKVSQRKIGEMFGISQQQVSKIVRGSRWKHLTA